MRIVKRVKIGVQGSGMRGFEQVGVNAEFYLLLWLGMKHVLPGSLVYLEDQMICLVTMFWKLQNAL